MAGERSDEFENLIKYKDRMKQPINFGGISYGNITPTDIDWFIEYRDSVYVFGEFKYRKDEMPKGQKIALERIADNFHSLGKHVMLVFGVHDVRDWNDTVYMATTEAEGVYYEGKWHDPRGRSVKEVVDDYFEYMEGRGIATPLRERRAAMGQAGEDYEF